MPIERMRRLLAEIERQLNVIETRAGETNASCSHTQLVIGLKDEGESYRAKLAGLRLELQNVSLKDGSEDKLSLNGNRDCIWKIPAFCLPCSAYIQPRLLLKRCLEMQNLRNRRGNSNDSMTDLWESSVLKLWARNEGSNLIVIQGTSQSTSRLERFSCEIVKSLSDRQTTIYMINSNDTRDYFKTGGPVELLRQVSIQALQNAMPSKPIHFLVDILGRVQEASTLAAWFQIMDTIMQQFSALFIVIDLSILGGQWKMDAESLYQEFAGLRTRSLPCIKVMLLTNRKQFQVSKDVFSIEVGSKSPPMPLYRTKNHKKASAQRGSLPIFVPRSPQTSTHTSPCDLSTCNSPLHAQRPNILLHSSGSNAGTETSCVVANQSVVPMADRNNTACNTQAPKENTSVLKLSQSDSIFPMSDPLYRSSAASRRQEIDVAIICALSWEADAMEVLFDELLDIHNFSKLESDTNTYSVGIVGRHKAVLVFMPSMGQSNAATAATNCCASFPKIRLALITGICGGVPRPDDKTEIVLGDVVVSDGIVFFDFGDQFPDGFQRKNTPAGNARKPPAEIQGFLAKLKTRRNCDRLAERTALHINSLHESRFRDWATYPGTHRDVLFPPSYHHKHRGKATCKQCADPAGKEASACGLARKAHCGELQCDIQHAMHRKRHEIASESSQDDLNTNPAIFFGMYASGDKVMKSGEDRDIIACKEGVLAFEMEGAGIWDKLPCLIVKGVCDYADSHKNKDWQKYAATTAAACTKALLEEWSVRPS